MTDHHVAPADYGMSEKTLGIYTLGIVLCVILTIIPFAAVMWPTFSTTTTVWLILASAFTQFAVQLICFLRLHYGTEQARINVQSFALTLFILFIVIAGSLWIMVNLHHRMM